MKDLVIESNPHNGGFCCDFEHKGKKYYADLCTVFDCGDSECMIFGCNETKEGTRVDFGRDLYCKRNIPVSEESLKNCIEEFTKYVHSNKNLNLQSTGK